MSIDRARFVRMLRRLRSIDKDEFPGPQIDHTKQQWITEWPHCQADPVSYFLSCGDETQRKIFEILVGSEKVHGLVE
jgi:hypothetical protein